MSNPERPRPRPAGTPARNRRAGARGIARAGERADGGEERGAGGDGGGRRPRRKGAAGSQRQGTSRRRAARAMTRHSSIASRSNRRASRPSRKACARSRRWPTRSAKSQRSSTGRAASRSGTCAYRSASWASSTNRARTSPPTRLRFVSSRAMPASLRGGSEAMHSNRAIAECVREGLSAAGLPEDAVQLIATTGPARWSACSLPWTNLSTC